MRSSSPEKLCAAKHILLGVAVLSVAGWAFSDFGMAKRSGLDAAQIEDALATVPANPEQLTTLWRIDRSDASGDREETPRAINPVEVVAALDKIAVDPGEPLVMVVETKDGSLHENTVSSAVTAEIAEVLSEPNVRVLRLEEGGVESTDTVDRRRDSLSEDVAPLLASSVEVSGSAMLRSTQESPESGPKRDTPTVVSATKAIELQERIDRSVALVGDVAELTVQVNAVDPVQQGEMIVVTVDAPALDPPSLEKELVAFQGAEVKFLLTAVSPGETSVDLSLKSKVSDVESASGEEPAEAGLAPTNEISFAQSEAAESTTFHLAVREQARFMGFSRDALAGVRTLSATLGVSSIALLYARYRYLRAVRRRRRSRTYRVGAQYSGEHY